MTGSRCSRVRRGPTLMPFRSDVDSSGKWGFDGKTEMLAPEEDDARFGLPQAIGGSFAHLLEPLNLLFICGANSV